MSIKVLYKEFPHRSIALVTTSHALVFRHSPISNYGSSSSGHGHPVNSNAASFSSLVDRTGAVASAPRIIVEFNHLSNVDLHEYRPLSHPCKGTLGLMNLGGDVFLCVVAGSSHVATVRPKEKVERIHSVEFRKHSSTSIDYRCHHQNSLTHWTSQIVSTALIMIA